MTASVETDIFATKSLSDVDTSLVTGIANGGIISINGGDNTKFDITAGRGFVVDNHTDPDNPVVTAVTWTAFIAVTATLLASEEVTAIGINSGGSIVQQADAFDGEDHRDFIAIGLLLHPDNLVIDDVIQTQRPVFNRFLGAFDFEDSIGVVTKSGNVYSPNGANLNINKSAGETFRVGSNYANDFKDPNITTDPSDVALTFNYEFQDGSGDFTVGADTTVIDPDQFDDGDGTLGSVPNNKFTIQRFHYFSALNITRVLYGQTIYNNLAEAEAAILGEVFITDPLLQDVTAFRGWLLVKKGNTDLSDTSEAKFIAADKFGTGASGGGTTATTTLQQSYNNSMPDPEILTNSIQGAFTIKRGSDDDTDDVFEVKNGAGAQTFAVHGDGFSGLKSGAFGDPSIGPLSDLDTYRWFSPDKVNEVVGGVAAFSIEEIGGTIITTNFGFFTSTSDIITNTFIRGPFGSAALPTFAFSGDTNVGMFRAATDALGFSAGGVEAFRCTNVVGTVTTKMNGPLDMNTKLIDNALGALMKEQASDPGTVGAGEGVYWVENTTPSRPVFTDDTGSDHVLNKNIKSGRATGILDGGSQVVTFGKAFANTPNVVATLENTNAADDGVRVSAISTTGFTIHIKQGHGGGADTWDVQWVATDAGDP